MNETVNNIEEIFGSDVFTLQKMEEVLPKSVYKEVKQVATVGGRLSEESADVVANAMKDWAISKGATHYTHWFQPLTVSITAEKHDSFVTHPSSDGKMLTRFSGKQLLMGEPDASSFPSGGLRETAAARGYTIWDPTSPAFVKEDGIGVVLYIPTAFCSYTGEALDKKTPLLRSMEKLSTEAMRIVKLFDPDTKATRVVSSVGPEQEYFLIDEEDYLKRKDLIFTGHTLFGAPAPKGQELEDFYFAAIDEKIGAYMKDLNHELWKLGISATTQHNEVAPAQHEMAPIYATANIAVDNNALVMEIMQKVARRHHLVCLLHEKPFAGVNGSGKHNNWSIGTDTGVNLCDPGDTPSENKQFLLVLASIMKAVDRHADLLRQSASDVGNDHRLGANEAPPAIISMFLGDQLEDVVEQIIKDGTASTCVHDSTLDLGAKTLPVMEKDATDRNRTSPFAFTGNKFEFRMVGSMDSIAMPNITLNAIVAEAFAEAADVLEEADDFDAACDKYIAETMTAHQRIIFNGNGYSDEWVEEAERRGLPNIKTMVGAVETLTTPKAIKVFDGILSETELKSREEVLYETYALVINIEALTMIDMASKDILPAVIKYSKSLADTVVAITSAGGDADVQKTLLSEISSNLSAAKAALDKLKADQETGIAMEGSERAFFYADVIKPDMEALRAPVDALEQIVDSKSWPLPTYEDMLFEI